MIGGIAAVVHGVPRATFDVELLIEASPENASRLLAALREAGIATADLTTPDGILAHEITVFRGVLRIDVQTRTPGAEFSAAWRDRVSREIGGTKCWIVAREHMIAMKEAAGRLKDLEDVRVLRGSA